MNKIEIQAHHDGELSDDFIEEAQQLFVKYGFTTSVHRTALNVIIVASPNQLPLTVEPVAAQPEINVGVPGLDPNGPQEFVTTLGSSESAENSSLPPEINVEELPTDDAQEVELPAENTFKGKCVIRNLSSYNAVDYVVNEQEPFSKLLVSAVTAEDTIKFEFGGHVHYLPRYEGRAGTSINTPNLLADNIVRFIISLGDVGNTESFPCILEVCEFQGADSTMVIFGQDMAEYVKSNAH
jgi:hypothetical protein